MTGKLIASTLACFLSVSCCLCQPANNPKWEPLFNGKDLDGWDTYLGPSYDTITRKRQSEPIGLNNDPSGVFSIVRLDNENVIRISGQDFGGISTKREFRNYHLQLQFRWGQLKWAPRKNGKRDSGLMYHAVGAHGADGGNWMRSHEFQIEEGDVGDYWACAGAAANATAKKEKDTEFIYNPEGISFAFSIASPNGRRCIKMTDAEKPSGEWNTLDLYCFGNTSVHVVNGVVTMILNNSRQLDEGKENPLIQGKIQIQSEGAEVFYRNIKIASIDKIPAEILDSVKKRK